MAKVKLYSRIPCAFCNAAKNLLSARGLEFEEIDLTGKYDELAELMEKTGMRTMPQIFFGDRFIGGYQELAAMDKEQDLNALADAS